MCVGAHMCLHGGQRSGWSIFLNHFFALLFVTFKNLCSYDVFWMGGHIYVCKCGCVHVTGHVWKSEDNLRCLFSPPCLRVGLFFHCL